MRKIPKFLKSRFEKVKGHSRAFKISADQFKRLLHSGKKAKIRSRLYKNFHKLLVKKIWKFCKNLSKQEENSQIYLVTIHILITFSKKQ